MRRLIPTAALAACLLALVPATSRATIDRTPAVDCTVHPYDFSCIGYVDPDDLPQPIDPPDIDDPAGPGEPTVTDRVCTARVGIDNATSTGHLETLIACPGGASVAGFNQAKLAMLSGAPSGTQPKCNRLNDVIRLHYPFARGMTFTSPELGECLRGGTVAFSRQF
jgi:hypothetical protein